MQTLEEIGYAFDRDGVLRDRNGDKFQFTTQTEYERLGEAITQEIYHLLETRCNMQRAALRPYPKGEVHHGNFVRREDDDKYSFVFVSRNFAEASTLLVLIHGTGVVRAGQWARKLLINDSLETGSQIPYIERALERGWAVVVANTNQHCDNAELLGSQSPSIHGKNLLNVFGITHKKIFIVAHSMGGSVTNDAIRASTSDCVNRLASLQSLTIEPHQFDPTRLRGVFLTDSFGYSTATMQWMRQKLQPFFPDYEPPFSLNFVAQKVPPRIEKGICGTVYCGENTHELSSHGARDAIFCAIDAIVQNRDPIQALDSFYHCQKEVEDRNDDVNGPSTSASEEDHREGRAKEEIASDKKLSNDVVEAASNEDSAMSSELSTIVSTLSALVESSSIPPQNGTSITKRKHDDMVEAKNANDDRGENNIKKEREEEGS